jgi:hypothetical protein
MAAETSIRAMPTVKLTKIRVKMPRTSIRIVAIPERRLVFTLA